ncbi:MAG TPA: hypothetical protein VFD30_06440 [Terriglobia bacterium]|jgi:hypothetical protein|nr:hypothetical protein [Terriglobia bacterium]
MKWMTGFALVAVLVCLGAQSPLIAQTCQDDEAMAANYTKDISDLVAAVKKESLVDFEKNYHQKKCLTKLNLAVNIVGQVADCYNKAAQSTEATKEEIAAAKAKAETYSKLKANIEQSRNSLKSTEVAKDAKALIEKIDLSH